MTELAGGAVVVKEVDDMRVRKLVRQRREVDGFLGRRRKQDRKLLLRQNRERLRERRERGGERDEDEMQPRNLKGRASRRNEGKKKQAYGAR